MPSSSFSSSPSHPALVAEFYALTGRVGIWSSSQVPSTEGVSLKYSNLSFTLHKQHGVSQLGWLLRPFGADRSTCPDLCAYLLLRPDNDCPILRPGVYQHLQVEGVSMVDVINRAIHLKEEQKGLGEIGKVALASSEMGTWMR